MDSRFFMNFMAAGLSLSLPSSSHLAFAQGFWLRSDNSQSVSPFIFVRQSDTKQQSLPIGVTYDIIGNNHAILQSFKELKKGWNGYEAEEISQSVIDKVYGVLFRLIFQPKLFPTGRDSIQIEYQISDDTFFELEVSDDTFSMYLSDKGQEIEMDVTKEEAVEMMNSLVDKYE